MGGPRSARDRPPAGTAAALGTPYPLGTTPSVALPFVVVVAAEIIPALSGYVALSGSVVSLEIRQRSPAAGKEPCNWSVSPWQHTQQPQELTLPVIAFLQSQSNWLTMNVGHKEGVDKTSLNSTEAAFLCHNVTNNLETSRHARQRYVG